MSYAGITPTKFGRYGVVEPFRPETFHLYRGEPLKTVDWEPPVPVLDQEDLLSQGIKCSTFIPGAQNVDALGSCTCNAGTASLAERYGAVRGDAALASVLGLSTTNAVQNEIFAIKLYNAVTDQTGDPSSEWPPTDCGSTGLYVCQELIAQKLVAGYKSAASMESLISLLQGGSVIIGQPFFNAWMDPDAQGFVDDSGSRADLEHAISSGVAGGHETCISAVETLVLLATGAIDLQKTVVRVRNSWSKTWGDNGSYRFHLSTLGWLGNQCDYKAFVVGS